MPPLLARIGGAISRKRTYLCPWKAASHDQRHFQSDRRVDRWADDNAFPWDEVASHLIRDRDETFGPADARRIRPTGIRDHLRRQARHGRTATSSGSSGQYVANASTTWWCSTKLTRVAF
jgi:hypothetical protein